MVIGSSFIFSIFIFIRSFACLLFRCTRIFHALARLICLQCEYVVGNSVKIALMKITMQCNLNTHCCSLLLLFVYLFVYFCLFHSLSFSQFISYALLIFVYMHYLHLHLYQSIRVFLVTQIELLHHNQRQRGNTKTFDCLSFFFFFQFFFVFYCFVLCQFFFFIAGFLKIILALSSPFGGATKVLKRNMN